MKNKDLAGKASVIKYELKIALTSDLIGIIETDQPYCSKGD